MDNTTNLILDMLVELLDNEPPQDAGGHPSLEVHERAGHAWAEWDKQVTGLRIILGVRLVNQAIATHRERVRA